jgi:aminoglycoside phosphotransferase (APT) family kinase protein
MRRGELLGSGRSADVYAIDGQWVLRRYRVGVDATAEAVVMAYVGERGYPVPRVRDPAGAAGAAGSSGPAADGSAPRTDLVMRRLHGPSMLAALRQGACSADQAGAMLADLLRRLHAIPARVSADPADRVLHLDLHPDNVMLTPDGPMVIDWCNTEEGAPGLDRAKSALILAQAAVDTIAEATLARAVLLALLTHLGPGVARADADAGHLAGARARRAADPAMSAHETRLLGEAVGLIRALAPARPL